MTGIAHCRRVGGEDTTQLLPDTDTKEGLQPPKMDMCGVPALHGVEESIPTNTTPNSPSACLSQTRQGLNMAYLKRYMNMQTVM